MLKDKKILFRTDGSSRIGLGHIMRCLALAGGFAGKGADCTFALRDNDMGIPQKIREKGFQSIIIPGNADKQKDLQMTLGFIDEYDIDIVITDSYDIDTSYLTGLKRTGVFLLSIDDLAAHKFPSRIVLNENISARKEKYHTDKDTILLLGPQYALLRSEFYKRHDREKVIKKEPDGILITMGGVDPDNQTLKVVRSIKRINTNKKGLKTTVVVGKGYGYKDELLGETGNENNFFRVKTDVDNMVDLMHNADIAISGGGVTSYELLCMGVPSILIITADNQRASALELRRRGYVVCLGEEWLPSEDEMTRALDVLIKDNKRRALMAAKGSELVDGMGVERVVMILKDLI